jgi:hypothetical protein
MERPLQNLFGCMKGQVTIPAGLDLSQLDFQYTADTK